MKKYFFLAAAVLAFFPSNVLAEQQRVYQTGETSPMEFAQKFEKQQFLLGGGGNVVLSTSDAVDTIAGGVVKARYTLDFLSLETALEFNRLPVQSLGTNGLSAMGFRSDNGDDDIFALPIIPTLMIHLPPWDNFRCHVFGGVGYQFNDSEDVEVDVTRGGVPVGTLDVEVDDGVIAVVGGGFDITLTRHLLFNFDVRYQFAEFDVESSGVLAGVPIEFTEEEDFDAVVLRGCLLYLF